MRRRFQTVCLLLLTGAAGLHSQDRKDFILAARRTTLAELIDPTTLQTVTRLHFDFSVERLFASSDGSALYVNGLVGGGCCEEYAVDLGTLKLRSLGEGEYGSRNFLVSPDARWRVQLRSFRGPALERYDLRTGAAQELMAARLPLSEDNCAGNWAARGTWSGDRFYFYIACPRHPGYLWTVSPGDTRLGQRIAVAPFAQAPNCLHPLPVEKELVAAGGKLYLYEPFGGKSDRTEMCKTALPGGAWVLDPATGRLTHHIAGEIHFNSLLPDPSGSTLYGVDPGNATWSGPVRLVVVSIPRGQVTNFRTFDPGVLQISLGKLQQIPAGDVHITSR